VLSLPLLSQDHPLHKRAVRCVGRPKLGEERGWLLRSAAIAFAINKFLVIAVTVAGSREQWGPRSFLGFLYYLFVHNFRYFDSDWYTKIAAHGYQPKGTAFFPLYPLLIRGVSEILHISPLAAGVLISNIAFFFALYFFLKLARLDLDRTRAARATIILALFPTAFFFSSAYTEALFVLLASLALYSMRTRRWGRAGGYGGLAAVTRNTGFALGVPFLIEYWESWRERRRVVRASQAEANTPIETAIARRRIPWSVLWVLLIGAGVVAYLGYLWWKFGDPLVFVHAEGQYGRGSLMPWSTLHEGYAYNLRILFHLHRPLDWNQIYYITQLFFPTLVLVVLVTSFRKLRWSYWVMILYSFVMPLTVPANVLVIDYFVGFSRYSLAIVPLFFGLERLLKRRWLFWPYLCLSIVLLLLFTYAWSRHKVVA
jgi:Gpi18-like mannosyltransferase